MPPRIVSCAMVLEKDSQNLVACPAHQHSSSFEEAFSQRKVIYCIEQGEEHFVKASIREVRLPSAGIKESFGVFRTAKPQQSLMANIRYQGWLILHEPGTLDFRVCRMASFGKDCRGNHMIERIASDICLSDPHDRLPEIAAEIGADG